MTPEGRKHRRLKSLKQAASAWGVIVQIKEIMKLTWIKSLYGTRNMWNEKDSYVHINTQLK